MSDIDIVERLKMPIIGMGTVRSSITLDLRDQWQKERTDAIAEIERLRAANQVQRENLVLATDHMSEQNRELSRLRAGRAAEEGGVTRPMIEYRQELRKKREAELRAAVWAECKEAGVKVADGWLASFEDGPEIQFTPARKYAADAVKDIRDALRGLKTSN